MSASTVTVTKTRDSSERNTYKVYGTLSFSASPDTYSTGGNTCSFAQSAIKATRKPLRVAISGTSGYVYKYIPGTNASDGKIMIYTGAAAQSPLTELSAGAIPAGVSGDSIGFEAVFAGML